jgi:hypothetical protein
LPISSANYLQLFFLFSLALAADVLSSFHDGAASLAAALLKRTALDEPLVALFAFARPVRQFAAQRIRQEHSCEHRSHVAAILPSRGMRPESATRLVDLVLDADTSRDEITNQFLAVRRPSYRS